MWRSLCGVRPSGSGAFVGRPGPCLAPHYVCVSVEAPSGHPPLRVLCALIYVLACDARSDACRLEALAYLHVGLGRVGSVPLARATDDEFQVEVNGPRKSLR